MRYGCYENYIEEVIKTVKEKEFEYLDSKTPDLSGDIPLIMAGLIGGSTAVETGQSLNNLCVRY